MITRYAALALLACGLTTTAVAQDTLQDLVTQARAEWMFGRWQGESENGDKVDLTVSWDLEKHVVLLHVKAGDMESKGYSAKDPRGEEVKYVSFDNRGSVGKGTWGMESDELVLRTESQSPERGPWKVAFVFTGSTSEGLKIRMHSVDQYGDMQTPARATFTFKKQK